MFVNIQHIQQWQQKFNSWSRVAGDKFTWPSVMTGSDLKKLTEGELGIGWGGGGEFRVSECDFERDTEKESGWPGGGGGQGTNHCY